MRDELANTQVEVWTAETIRVEDLAFEQHKFERVEVHPPKLLKTVELPMGAALELGRATARSRNRNAIRVDLTDTNEDVSRVALVLREGSSSTSVEIEQLGGIHLQVWGHRGTWYREMGTIEAIQSLPTSFRIDTNTQSFWILVNPAIRTVPPQYRPLDEDKDEVPTNLNELNLPNSSTVHTDLKTALPELKFYFKQFLEWPPRPSPETTGPQTQGQRKKIVLLSVSLSTVGFPKRDAQSRPVELLEFLVRHRLIDVEDDIRVTRTETIRPADKKKRISSIG